MIDDTILVTEVILVGPSVESIDTTQPYLRNVKKLDFTDSCFTEIPSGLSQTLVNVKTLDISRNHCLKMKKHMFSNLTTLKFLSLNTNNYDNVDPEWFSGLINLEYIDLSNNDLTTLDYKGLVLVCPSLRTIDVDYNDFSCDFLREMMNYLKNQTNARIKETSAVEIEDHGYSKSIYGVLCGMRGSSYSSLNFDWIGVGIISVVALVTAVVLYKKDSCKICRGNEAYDDMETTTREENNTNDDQN